MKLSTWRRSQIVYIENVLNKKFNGTSITDMMNFIDEHFHQALAKERTFDTYIKNLQWR